MTPRVALNRQQAAEALGVSLTTFKTRIQPDLPVVRLGSVRLFEIADLEEWMRANKERPMAEIP